MSWSIHCDRCGVTHSVIPSDGDMPRYWREIDGLHYCGGGRWGNGCARKKAREKAREGGRIKDGSGCPKSK
jgi:hypothetical protein